MGSTELYGTAVPGRMLYPLFCVGVHEHMWMATGYGMWGMAMYLEHFYFGLGGPCGARIRSVLSANKQRACIFVYHYPGGWDWGPCGTVT